MRQTYIVAYDVCDPKRLRKVFRTMRGWGDHLHDEDQVLFVDVGPVEGRGSESIRALGKPYTHPERHALVV